ncbi:uncharacterized protein LOC112085443 [Eutrema salsugineum]|uniref:uncharacterized protein LOC112085443 n=1 Tax=Eutrema salsugineum TaxID=72664 RepID=UPI000CED57A5|nr:uncharacterized protein LOC112085443 [Eutrema salsugineum]
MGLGRGPVKHDRAETMVSRDPKGWTRGDQISDTELPKRMIAAGAEPWGQRVITYQKFSIIQDLVSALDDEEIKFIRESPLGKLLDIPTMPAWSGTFGLFLLSRARDIDEACEDPVNSIIRPEIVFDPEEEDLSWEYDHVDPVVDNMLKLISQEFKFEDDMFVGGRIPSQIAGKDKKRRENNKVLIQALTKWFTDNTVVEERVISQSTTQQSSSGGESAENAAKDNNAGIPDNGNGHKQPNQTTQAGEHGERIETPTVVAGVANTVVTSKGVLDDGQPKESNQCNEDTDQPLHTACDDYPSTRNPSSPLQSGSLSVDEITAYYVQDELLDEVPLSSQKSLPSSKKAHAFGVSLGVEARVNPLSDEPLCQMMVGGLVTAGLGAGLSTLSDELPSKQTDIDSPYQNAEPMNEGNREQGENPITQSNLFEDSVADPGLNCWAMVVYQVAGGREAIPLPGLMSEAVNEHTRKSKRPRVVSSRIDDRYQCDKRLTILIGQETEVEVTKARKLDEKVMDGLIQFSRHMLRVDMADGVGLRVDLLDTEFVVQLTNLFPRFSKTEDQGSFVFPKAVVGMINGEDDSDRVQLYEEAEFVYMPFNFDQRHWVTLAVDLKGKRIQILDCNVALLNDNRLTNELQRIAKMLPYLFKGVSANEGMSQVELSPFAIERVSGIHQISSPFDSGMYSIFLLQTHAVGGLEGCRQFGVLLLESETKKMIVSLIRHYAV